MTSFQGFYKNSTPTPFVYPEIKGENQHQITNVLLIDSHVKDYQTFVDSVNSNTFPIVYSIHSSKTELLPLLQTKFTHISRIGIVFTSNLGNTQMFLDRKPLFATNETDHSSENLQFIVNVIKEFSVKNIDFLACNTLNYPNWVNYYQLLTQQTGVVVGASNDKTGNITYGGDWVMESTLQDIENVYFTKSIEYYTYLLDANFWANTNGGWPYGSIIYGSYMYVSNQDAGTIVKISLSDPTQVTQWATGLDGPAGLAIDGSFMYVCSTYIGIIYKIRLSDPTQVTQWANGFIGANGSAIYGSFLYICSIIDGNIYKIRLADSSDVTIIANIGGEAEKLIIYNSNIYVTNSTNGSVYQISLSDPTQVTQWATGLAVPSGLAIDRTFMYVASFSSGIIYQIDLFNPSIVTQYITLQTTLNPLLSYNNYLYVGISRINQIYQISLPPLPFPCFKEDSKILTNHGYKLIQHLKKGDLVKTLKHGFKSIDMIGKRVIYHPASNERIKDQLYQCSKENFEEVFEPLVITGCHSILVDKFINDKQREKAIEINNNRIFITDKKYRLPACADERAAVYDKQGNYTIYHLALENDDYYMNYGIYANGLLVETCSKRYLKELSNMTLID